MEVVKYNAGVKDYVVTQWTDFNSCKTKLVEPVVQGIDEGNVIVQSDKVWRLENGEYVCHDVINDYVSPKVDEDPIITYHTYIENVLGHQFVGATDDFAVYDATNDESAFIMVGMNLEQFATTLFSNPALVNPFMSWLRKQVSYQTDHYLEANHASFIEVVN